MLLLLDALKQKCLTYRKEKGLDEFLNKKAFSVRHTPLSYRQISVLGMDRLLEDVLPTGKWRKFSFKELVYIHLLNELKKFGIRHDQLMVLHQCFYAEPDKEYPFIDLWNKDVSEMAIIATFCSVEISVLSFDKGRVVFCDPYNLLEYGYSSETHIHINLNKIVNALWIQLKKEPIIAKYTLSDYYSKIKKALPTVKEKQAIDLIRNKDFSVIRIKKKDGQIDLVYAEMSKSDESTPSSVDLVQMLKESDFQDISIVQRNGRIVNYKVEQTFKI